MSYQAVSWALYDAPHLPTDKGKPDTTARQVLVVLAEHADGYGCNAFPTPLRTRYATGLDERTIQRALLRLERAELITRDGLTRQGVVRWKLAMSRTRPESEWAVLEAEAEETRRVESDRRRARRDRAASMHRADVRDGNSRRPGVSVPDAGTQNPGVRDGTPPEPPTNRQGTTKEPSTGGTLPPDPLRHQDPPTSDLATEQDQEIYAGRDEQPQPLDRDSRPRAQNADEPALPNRCPHGLASRRRPDGQLSCALCRRHDAEQPLADVIPIRTAR